MTKTRKLTPSLIYHFPPWTTRKGAQLCARTVGITTKDFPLFLRTTYDLLDEKNQKIFVDNVGASLVAARKRAGTSPAPTRCVFLNQVHGNEIAVLDDPARFDRPGFYPIPRTDGVITNISDLMLIVMTADCLPIFFQAGEWIGLVHAGWRGTQKQIAVKALQKIVSYRTQSRGEALESAKTANASPRDCVRCTRRTDIRVAFGPCIRPCHYEVGPEFKEYFNLIDKNEKLYFDLAAENKRQLTEAGLSEDNINDCGICTVCENDRFYSFRKEKDDAGRMISWICR